ncbi:MBL fold metallo-hydrolase [Streptomyces sp. TX20-6-3]|uniref:MBL fold metallo-hydrolase n=1 Tax=Streptomyces sp. TX20-6-3 TaxID=3028705 RepID=UPI0029A7434C|nr:MBL fold metallo-hydrolase [Streptomyces sp. TX20-6-3]MDX2560312.1 MBL fold metallo-hydrolase [Streptomyces sp. TX20-6-3]
MTQESAQRMVVGDVEVIRVVEWQGPFVAAGELVPSAGEETWKDNEDWLAPDHWDPESDRAVMALQTWVLRSGGRTVLVDTGVGNGRERPGAPQFHHWQGDFLGALERAGVRPEDVDVVVNTHLHADHVGWNTRAADGSDSSHGSGGSDGSGGSGGGGGAGGEWVPAFPRAEYLVPAADDAHFGPDNAYGGGRNQSDRFVYEDSVAPLHREGRIVLWDGVHRIDEHLTLESAPGHTPGSSVLRLASAGERAVFVGDLMHSPVQILDPAHNSCFCLDARGASASRRRILGRAADERELVVPAHFGGSGIAEVRREGGGFGLLGREPGVRR